MGGTFGNAVNEARDVSNSILALLGAQNDMLAQLVKKAEATPLTKFDVLAEAQLRTFSIPKLTFPAFTKLFEEPAGVYTQIDHWAWNSYTAEPGEGALSLAIGDGQRIVSIIDTGDSQSNRPVNSGGKSNPIKLIIPPNIPVLASAPSAIEKCPLAILTISYTTYRLAL